MKNTKILLLLLISILILQPLTLSVEGVTRYTRITGEDPFYIFTTEATNSSNTHFRSYRIELNPNTYDIINKTAYGSIWSIASGNAPRTPPPSYYYDNYVLTYGQQYDTNSLTETPLSQAHFSNNYLSSQGQQASQGYISYSPLNKQIYFTHNAYAGSPSWCWSSSSIIYDAYGNVVNSQSGTCGSNVPVHTRILFPHGFSYNRHHLNSGYYTYPNTNVRILEAKTFPSPTTPTSYETLSVGGADPQYFYTKNSASTIIQYSMNNQTESVRTISTLLTDILAHRPISTRSNYLYSVGYFTIVDPDNSSNNYNVASFDVRDRFGNLVTGQNSVIADTQYNFITELETGDIALIRHNTNNGYYYLEFRNPVTLNLIKSIQYEEQAIFTIASRLTNRKGIDPIQFNLMNSGVYSRDNGGFDSVPRDAYIYMNNGTEPSGITINNVDFTNKVYEFTINLDSNIDYYPLYFLLDDNDFKTGSNERYGSFILNDMTSIGSINTGIITATDNYTLTTALSNNRFYVLDTNITLLNTTDHNYSTMIMTFNADALFGLVNYHILPSTIPDFNYLYVGLFTPYSASPFLDEKLLYTPHLLAYPQIAGASHDYTNLKILVDKINNRYSIKKTTYFGDGSSMDSGFTTWSSLPSTDSITEISLVLQSGTSVDMDMDIYRANTLPSMNTLNPDTKISTAKSLMVPILKTSNSNVNIIYSDYSTIQHANIDEWTIIVNTIGGDILGIGPDPTTTPTIPADTELAQGTLLFGGLLPDFMPTTQQSAMIYALGIILLVMIIVFIIGHGAGYAMIGGIGSLFFGIMLLIFFSLFGWIPAWIPVIAFVLAGLLGAGMIRNSLAGGSA